MIAKLITYKPPVNISQTADYIVEVNSSSLFLYQAQVYYPPYLELKKVPFGYFDFEGEVTIGITTKIKVDTVDIRPKSLGIVSTFDQHTITFKLKDSVRISVEINGDIDNAILLFANPLEKEIPSPEDENVIYFGPGIYDVGVMQLESKKTYYIAGGAFVYGKFEGINLENTCIMGRGILCAEKLPREVGQCVNIENSRNLKIEGIIIIDPPEWTVKISGCDEVDIQNIKIIGWRGNSDGIDICGSKNVKVSHCFIRNWDDGLAIKAFNTGDVWNITFSDCVLWNDFARPIEIGYENQADFIGNIVIRNIDIIHCLSGYPIMGIHQGDRAIISDITFEDIRIEDAPNSQLFDFKIKASAWNRDDKLGRIHNIKFKNIYLNGKPGIERLPENSRMGGYDNISTIEEVSFENVYILGKKVTSLEDCNIECNEYTKNIRFIDDKESLEVKEVVSVESTLDIVKPFKLDENGYWNGSVGIGVKNLSEVQNAIGTIALDITPETDLHYIKGNSFTYSLEPRASGYKEFEVNFLPGKYFVTTQSTDVGLRRSWEVLELPWHINKLNNVKEELENTLLKATSRELIHFDQSKAGTVRLVALENELVIEADIIDESVVSENLAGLNDEKFTGKRYMMENEPWKQAAIEIFAATPTLPEKGEAIFSLPETAVGRTTAIIQGVNGHILAPELRNILEITYVFKNQPKVEKIAHLVLEPKFEEVSSAYSVSPQGNMEKLHIYIHTDRTKTGYKLRASIPFEAMALADNDDKLWFEVMVSTVLPGTKQRRAITLFHSLLPETCCHMFGRIKIRGCIPKASQ